MVEIRPVDKSELLAIRRLHEESVGDLSSAVALEWYRENPDLFVGAFDGPELVGYCLGRGRSEDLAELHGIGVQDPYTRQGIGTDLLARFEEAAAAGFDGVTIRSVGGYVDEFYLANGYEPASVLVRLPAEEVPEEYPREFDVVEEQVVDGTAKLYVDADGHDPAFLESVREAFGDPDAVYVMEKRNLDDGSGAIR
ncbi:hypothetical protein BRC81_04620 [Halobacteriales archaeon QS_1_68_20]|nr:MAG: hypothetical protein BRC81_04620 [Halobacteriales archaeon QS_1_68_20]